MKLLVGEGTGRSKVGWGGEKSTVGSKKRGWSQWGWWELRVNGIERFDSL